MSAEDEVRRASERFYAALNGMLNGDASRLADVWSHDSTVTTMHPIGGRQVGWETVRQTWDQVAQIASGGEVKLDEQLVSVAGEMAYEVGNEAGHATFNKQDVSIDHRVTNVYRREAGEWKIVHHHTDVSEAMQNVIGG
jgi:ketosteroid isomerase-like protein